jgi:hypothetical protein
MGNILEYHWRYVHYVIFNEVYGIGIYIYIIYREYCYIEYMVPQNLFWRLKFEQKWRLWNYELWAKQGKLDHWIHYVIPNQLDR